MLRHTDLRARFLIAVLGFTVFTSPYSTWIDGESEKRPRERRYRELCDDSSSSSSTSGGSSGEENGDIGNNKYIGTKLERL